MHTLTYFRLSIALLILVPVGCSYTPVRQDKKASGKSAGVDVFRAFLDNVRSTDNTRAGDEWTRFRGGFDQLNSHFIKPDVLKRMRELSARNRKFLESGVHLASAESAGELAEVESVSFRTIDAHYLDECFLMRDAVRSLEAGEQGTANQAHRLFRWAMRNVLPHEQTDSWTPPAFTLRRGYGNPRERALVFLSLLRQAQIEGCLIVTPEPEPKQMLVAALDANPSSPALYLFDPRLGLPLLDKNGSVLTLKDALADPALLKSAQITPEQAKSLQAWLVCPLYALSPRMGELQQGLNAPGVTYNLYLNAEVLAKEIGKATTLPVKVWNPPVDGKSMPDSPTRCLRTFIAKQDGGLDTTGRAILVERARSRIIATLANYGRVRLTEGLLQKTAFGFLQSVSLDFLNKYDLQPREMFLRGQYDPMIRRHERLQAFTQDNALVKVGENQQFLKELVDWLDKVRVANADLLSDDAKLRAQGQQAMQTLWAQDQFVAWMLETGKEDKLERRPQTAGEKQAPWKGKVVTGILAIGMRDHLELELARVQAATNHEKAETGQALLRSQKNPDAAAKARVTEDWKTAKMAWEKFYLDRIVLDAMVKQRLDQINYPDADPEQRVSLLESVHLEVQKYFDARLRVADCLERLENGKASVAYLQSIKSEIEKLEKAGLLKTEIAKQRQAIPAGAKRLDLLARTWEDNGSLAWMKHQIDQRVREVATR